MTSSRVDNPLTVPQVIQALKHAGFMPSSQADPVDSGHLLHPLVFIAQQCLPLSRSPQHILDSLDALCAWYAQHIHFPFEHLEPLKLDASKTFDFLSEAFAKRHQLLPLGIQTPGTLKIATAQPFVTQWTQAVQKSTHLKIQLVFANPLRIQKYRRELYQISQSIHQATRHQDQSTAEGSASAATNFEQLVRMHDKQNLDADDASIAHIVDWLWRYAFEQQASDIHIEPKRHIGIVRLRIHGQLQTVYEIPWGILQAITSRIKVLGRMNIVEKRRPQDGRIKTLTPQNDEIELRLSIVPTAFGEKLVMRIFDPQVLKRDFSALGFPPEILHKWSSLSQQTHGMLLVTGPTGSGKTTTLYTTLKQLAQPSLNISTLEDPIEMIESQFNQIQIQPQLSFHFSDGIRALLRQDPDVIMVGEVRDAETAQMATQAALTGHLVLSTLHTNDAVSAVTRLNDLQVPTYLIGTTLLGVMAQRLIRTLCPHCKTAHPTTPTDHQAWSGLTQGFQIPVPKQFYQAVGCAHCHHLGYSQRIGVYELLHITPALKALIAQQYPAHQLYQAAIENGMLPLHICAAQHIVTGQTSLEEVLRACPPEHTQIS